MTGAVPYGQDDALNPGRAESGCETKLNVRIIYGETGNAAPRADSADPIDPIDPIEAEARLAAALIKARMKRPIGEGDRARMPVFEDFACFYARFPSPPKPSAGFSRRRASRLCGPYRRVF